MKYHKMQRCKFSIPVSANNATSGMTCFEFMYEHVFTNESVCHSFEVASENNTSQILWRMVGLVEFYSYRESPAVALFMIIYIHTSIYLYVCIYICLYILCVYTLSLMLTNYASSYIYLYKK